MKQIAFIIFVGIFSVSLSFLSAQEQQRAVKTGGRPTSDSSADSALSPFKRAPISNSDRERKILSVLDVMEKNESLDTRNILSEDGRLLRLLTEALGTKNAVEIGTSNGYSAIWLSLALSQTGGKLYTFEADSQMVALARLNFKKAGVDDIVTLVEGDANNELFKIKEPVDILFLNLCKGGSIDYLEKLLPLVRPGGLILAQFVSDDKQGQKFVEAVTNNPQLDSVILQRENAFLNITLKKLSASIKTEKQPTINRKPDVQFVPTPQEVVEKMLELAQVKKSDLVYDLGCGDGRIVITAAKKYGCKAVGFDIDPNMIKLSLENVKKNNLEDLVTIEQADIFTLDLSKADVITLFLLPELDVKLIPQLEKCKPGTRIVSHQFDMGEIQADKLLRVHASESDSMHQVFLWIAPIKK